MFSEDEAKDWIGFIVEFEKSVEERGHASAADALGFAASLREAIYRDAEAGGWYCDLEQAEDEARARE